MTCIPNTHAKLIWEPARPWTLHVDNVPVGEWTSCRPWDRGIEGDVNGQTYRIDTIPQR